MKKEDIEKIMYEYLSVTGSGLTKGIELSIQKRYPYYNHVDWATNLLAFKKVLVELDIWKQFQKIHEKVAKDIEGWNVSFSEEKIDKRYMEYLKKNLKIYQEIQEKFDI